MHSRVFVELQLNKIYFNQFIIYSWNIQITKRYTLIIYYKMQKKEKV